MVVLIIFSIAPITPQEIPYLALFKHSKGPRKPVMSNLFIFGIFKLSI